MPQTGHERRAYKLTTADARTRPGQPNETYWGENVTHLAEGEGGLCGPGWLHAYRSPLLAALMSPAHTNYDPSTMLLWECRAVVEKEAPDKLGCTRLTTVRAVTLPNVTLSTRVAFALLAVSSVYKDPGFQKWAQGWLSGRDRQSQGAVAFTHSTPLRPVPYAAICAAEAGTKFLWMKTGGRVQSQAAYARHIGHAAAQAAAHAVGAPIEGATEILRWARSERDRDAAAPTEPAIIDLSALAEEAMNYQD